MKIWNRINNSDRKKLKRNKGRILLRSFVLMLKGEKLKANKHDYIAFKK